MKRTFKLERRDWEEIVAALESKIGLLERGDLGEEDFPGQDKKWIAHLRRIIRKIERPESDKAWRVRRPTFDHEIIGLLRDIKKLWDRAGLGDDTEESERVYKKLASVIRGRRHASICPSELPSKKGLD